MVKMMQNVLFFLYQQDRRGRHRDQRLQAGSVRCRVDKGTPVLASHLQGSSGQRDTVRAGLYLHLSHIKKNTKTNTLYLKYIYIYIKIANICCAVLKA